MEAYQGVERVGERELVKGDGEVREELEREELLDSSAESDDLKGGEFGVEAIDGEGEE